MERVQAHRFGYIAKLNHIQAAFSPFVFRYEGLRAVETKGKLGLRDFRCFPCLDKHLPQPIRVIPHGISIRQD
jgi:hypothetical protein